MSHIALDLLLNQEDLDTTLQSIAKKVSQAERITEEEGIYLYEHADLGYLGILANAIREKRHGNKTYFNRNFHIEPTNLCVFTCRFCAYSRLLKQKEDGWFMTADEMLEMVKKYDDQPVTEVHIVGGVHPKMNLAFFADLMKKVKEHRPSLHIKAFTAVEYDYIFRKAKMTYKEGLQYLKEHGLDSIPGGGAEIFDEEVRSIICGDKCTSDQWLELHETAHQLGIPSNCTMLYGHIETYAHRVDHMERLRQLQDRTNGFNTFIPLKYRSGDNEMTHLGEVSVIEDLKAYAMGRIYLDNFTHIKAYWPMIGRSTAQLSLAFGVNDIDGTIDDTTKIYSMAGAEEQNPKMSTQQIVDLIKTVDRHPIERDTVYNVVKDYKEVEFKDSFVELPVVRNYS